MKISKYKPRLPLTRPLNSLPCARSCSFFCLHLSFSVSLSKTKDANYSEFVLDATYSLRMGVITAQFLNAQGSPDGEFIRADGRTESTLRKIVCDVGRTQFGGSSASSSAFFCAGATVASARVKGPYETPRSRILQNEQPGLLNIVLTSSRFGKPNSFPCLGWSVRTGFLREVCSMR